MPTVTPQGNGSGDYISTRQALVEKVAATKGFSSADPALVVRVEEFLNDAVKDLNTTIWESSKTSASFALVLDQQYITLNTDFFKSSLVYITDSVHGDSAPLTEIPYVHFKRQFWRSNTDLSNHGTPHVYTIFNYEKTRRLLFDVAPDSNAATNFTLTVEYYRRLPLITSVPGENSPDIPDYFENTIVYGAKKRMCAHVGDENGVKVFQLLEKEALDHLRRIDIMQPDADHRFRIINQSVYNTTNRVYGFSPF